MWESVSVFLTFSPLELIFGCFPIIIPGGATPISDAPLPPLGPPLAPLPPFWGSWGGAIVPSSLLWSEDCTDSTACLPDHWRTTPPSATPPFELPPLCPIICVIVLACDNTPPPPPPPRENWFSRSGLERMAPFG